MATSRVVVVGHGMVAHRFVEALRSRDTENRWQITVLAEELDAALAILSSFDEGTDLVLYYKHLMVLEGNPEYALHFNATDALSAGQRHYAETQLRLFKAWYARWSEETAGA